MRALWAVLLAAGVLLALGPRAGRAPRAARRPIDLRLAATSAASAFGVGAVALVDRKSTRLNSSH